MPQNSGFTMGTAQPRRRPSLTPMIDVVFLLLVFFMLAARFGVDNAIPLSPALAGGGGYQGAPRLVTVGADTLKLNGQSIDLANLPGQLSALMPNPEAVVVLRAAEDSQLQDMVTVIDALSEAGMSRLVVAE